MVLFFECGGYTLNSDFDSGNLGRAELVKKYTDGNSECLLIISRAMTHFLILNEVVVSLFTNLHLLLPRHQLILLCNTLSVEIFNPGLDPLTSDHHGHASVNAEINVWTRPDCHGTQYENGNRTWFFFSVRGGKPSHILRLNVMNLNRQAKLFSQGMHPVIRIGASGKCERSKDRPSYRVSEPSALFLFRFVYCETTLTIEMSLQTFLTSHLLFVSLSICFFYSPTCYIE